MTNNIKKNIKEVEDAVKGESKAIKDYAHMEKILPKFAKDFREIGKDEVDHKKIDIRIRDELKSIKRK